MHISKHNLIKLTANSTKIYTFDLKSTNPPAVCVADVLFCMHVYFLLLKSRNHPKLPVKLSACKLQSYLHTKCMFIYLNV